MRWGRSTAVWSALLATLAASGCGSSAPAARPARVVFTAAPDASPGQVRATAARMQARYRALGVPDARVAVQGRRLLVSGPAAVARLAGPASDRGVLEFRPVRAEGFAGPTTPAPTGPDVRLSAPGVAPPTAYLVGPPGLTGGVSGATAVRSPAGDSGWVVEISLTPAGLRAMNRMARTQVGLQPPGNSLAILVDGRVQSAPAFMTSSFSGPIDIYGNFSATEAQHLAAILGVGSYPVAVTQVRRSASP